MNYYDILFAKKLGEATGTVEITENGTYDVSSYASASVNVSGGGGSAPTPVLKQKIIIKDSYQGTVYLSGADYIIDGKYVQVSEEQLSTGEYNVAVPIVKSRNEPDVFSFYPLARNYDTSDYGTATNLVNCELDTYYGYDNFYIVTDPTQDVSITTTFE